MERKFVVRYQGGSGGFLVAWLLQLAHDTRGAKSPSHVVDALNCFPPILKDKPLEWKDKEIIPPDIGILCNYFYPVIDKPIWVLEKYANAILNRIYHNNVSKWLGSMYDIEARIRYYFCNNIWKRVPRESLHKLHEISNTTIDDVVTSELLAMSNIIFDKSSIIFVTASQKFITMAQKEKKCGIARSIKRIEMHQHVEKDIYMTDIINNYKLNTFPIESIWENTWKAHLEEILSRELTAHQIQVCKLLISRWLYVTPQNIKDEFNI